MGNKDENDVIAVNEAAILLGKKTKKGGLCFIELVFVLLDS